MSNCTSVVTWPRCVSPAIGSRTILSHGSAYKLAAEQVIEKGKSFAAEALEVSGDDVEYANGRYRVKGTDRAITFAEVMQQCAAQTPHPLDTIAQIPIARAFPSGAHIAEIEIDRETGWASVVDYTAVDDIGTVINHTLADGQLHGGILQGAGQVFGENCLYDTGNGQLLAGSFMDYPMPRGAVAGYYPELNPLLPLEYYDKISGTPAAKSIPVRVVAA